MLRKSKKLRPARIGKRGFLLPFERRAQPNQTRDRSSLYVPAQSFPYLQRAFSVQ